MEPEAPSPRMPAESVAAPVRLLLVEDDEGDAVLVEDLLAGAPLACEIRRVRNAAEALAALGDPADCVLLDLGLPDAVGLEALHRIREAAPGAAVLVLTGLQDERRGTDALAAGAQDYLVKGAVDEALLTRSIRYAVERRRAEASAHELRDARRRAQDNARLERGLLPTPLVEDARLRFASGYRPGRRRAVLGGDFFDAVERPDGTLHLVIGDVAGHGPDEAALGVALRIAWRTLVLGGVPVGRLLPTLEQVLVHERHADDLFATLCSVTVRPDRTAAELRSAGHPPGALLAGARATLLPLPARRLPLGVVAGAAWEAVEVPLPPDWALLLFTDGLVEGAAAPAGAGPNRLGETGLLAVAEAHMAREPDWAARPAGLVHGLIAAAEERNGGPLGDDVAVLLAGCGPEGAAG